MEMRSIQKPKEVQSLTGRVAALSRFISKANDKCLPFGLLSRQDIPESHCGPTQLYILDEHNLDLSRHYEINLSVKTSPVLHEYHQIKFSCNKS